MARPGLKQGSTHICATLTVPQASWLKRRALEKDQQAKLKKAHAVSANTLIRKAIDFYMNYPELVEQYTDANPFSNLLRNQ